jgi:hypothetical protein
MNEFEIQVRGIYASATGALAREVLSIENGWVEYRDFALSDGEPISPCSRCSLHHFRRWSARPVTAEEQRRLRRDVADMRLRLFAQQSIPMALEAASDSALRAEIRRRGLRLVDDE